jgi:hypothetical protein
MQYGGGDLAIWAIVVHAKGGLNGVVDEVVRGEHVLLIKKIPLIEAVGVLVSERVVDGLLVDEVEEVDDDFEGVLALVAKKVRKLLVK